MKKASFKRSHRKAPVEPEPVNSQDEESQDASNDEGDGISVPPFADSDHGDDPSDHEATDWENLITVLLNIANKI